MDDTAQSSNNSYGDGGNNQSQQDQPNTSAQQQVPSQSRQSVAPSPSTQPVSTVPHKEQEPVSEHVQISDPVESQPELHPELKEHVDVRQDEAKLELTREQQELGMRHSPASTPVTPHVREEKPDFPLTVEQTEMYAKKASVWDPIRWLATLISKERKKKVLEKPAKA